MKKYEISESVLLTLLRLTKCFDYFYERNYFNCNDLSDEQYDEIAKSAKEELKHFKEIKE